MYWQFLVRFRKWCCYLSFTNSPSYLLACCLKTIKLNSSLRILVSFGRLMYALYLGLLSFTFKHMYYFLSFNYHFAIPKSKHLVTVTGPINLFILVRYILYVDRSPMSRIIQLSLKNRSTKTWKLIFEVDILNLPGYNKS